MHSTHQRKNIHPVPAEKINSRRKKTIKTTILNITDRGEQTREAIRFVLGNKKRLSEVGLPSFELTNIDNIRLKQDLPIGDVWLLQQGIGNVFQILIKLPMIAPFKCCRRVA
jgi:hypothetical protein